MIAPTFLPSPPRLVFHLNEIEKCKNRNLLDIFKRMSRRRWQKWTNERFDALVAARQIKRLGDVKNNRTPIRLLCLIDGCGRIWEASPCSIDSGTGCPDCGHRRTNTSQIFNNEIIDEKLRERTIKRIGKYINGKTRIEFECLICNYAWYVSPDCVLQGTGCPNCARKRRLTNKDVDDILKNRSIKRIGDYINNRTKIEFQCLICDHIWNTIPSSIFQGTGCPTCKSKNERIIEKYLIDHSIEFYYQFNLNQLIPVPRLIKIDFYIPKTNTLLEYDGHQHYEPVRFGNITIEQAQEKFLKQQERDQFVDQMCKENAITLIRINGMEYYGKKLISYLDILIPRLFYNEEGFDKEA
jgi:hypothetical protein